ncbi:tol-pal system protein YbgF [Thalassotalea euphylliae]|uniref:Cell division coordinator CpoB n=1 Tax=Thalassotalea euphylliae TaxID=1655234 RepID=A0A3E0UFS7_9GAMM|nr:tol-pal system protein YbgF [Thalassotalea euphylliae]REL24353.1 tol-pal system protein YbgF [Thalassotalea euphylliae]REL35891.1 tol-pal system protein YbgF [Thalassotalea euphylliae]
MKLNKVLFGLFVAASTPVVLAQQPAPVLEVNAGSGSLSDRIANLERQLSARNRAQVNIQRQLDELQTEMSELRGVTELHSHQLTQVLERQRELYQEIERRVSEALKTPAQVPAALAAPQGSAPATNYSSNLTENQAYDRAVNMVLKEKQYDKAIPEFQAFNKNFPNSSYAPNAHYWLGQLLFNKGELAQAAAEFDIVVQRHTTSNKRPDAMLKLGMVAQKQGQNAKAVAMYQQLIAQYPDSTAAQLAQPRLQSLQ